MWNKKNTVPTKRIEKRKKKGMFAGIGLKKEKEYFVENLSMLVASGMPVLTALNAIAQDVFSSRMKTNVQSITTAIENGSTIWKALKESGLFHDHTIALIRLGEESGRLSENLKVISVEEKKSRLFRSKIHSAMMYPTFVLFVTFVVGLGIAWFILPKLSLIFSQLKIELPWMTRVLIDLGAFLNEKGFYVLPLFGVFVFLLFYIFFFFSKTKWIGQTILLSLPGISGLIREIEIARFGYLLGTLLEAGVPITRALKLLAHATDIRHYGIFYQQLRDSLSEGNSFRKTFLLLPNIKKIIPLPIQQLIIVGEQSGNLSEVLQEMSESYEGKADMTTKNLTTILEPVILVIVWLGVVGVALSVILPIYSLVGGLNSTPSNSSPSNNVPPSKETAQQFTNSEMEVAETPAEEQQQVEETPISENKTSENTALEIVVLPTELGYLNVRENPFLKGKILMRVLAGEKYLVVQEKNNWYEISSQEVVLGWVFGDYVERVQKNEE